jgi:hypothetical protein
MTTIERRLALVALLTTACAPGEVDPDLEQSLESGDAAPPPVVDDSTPLEGCDKGPTLGEFEDKIMVARCGTSACHGADGRPFAPDLRTRPVHPRLVDRLVSYGATKCDKARDRYIDTRADPASSYLVSKVRDVSPTCPSGRPGGARMPFAVKDPLPDDEIACFVAYARALIGR